MKGFAIVIKVSAVTLLGLAVVLLGGCQPLQGIEQLPTATEQLQPATETSLPPTSASTGAGQAAVTTTTTTSPGAGAPATTTTTKPKPTPGQPALTTTSLMLSTITAVILPIDSWVRYEEDDPNLMWDGAWGPFPSTEASGGNCRLGNFPAACRLWIQGTGIQLVAIAGPGLGIAKLTLDDTYVYMVDLYAPPPGRGSVVVWTSPPLPFGSHNLLVEYTGTRNSASLSAYIDIDAVEVKGTLGK